MSCSPAPFNKTFPNLKEDRFSVTSPSTPSYNCIAWAAGDMTTWWWPDPQSQYFWPDYAPRECTLNAFIIAFNGIHYVPCESGDFEKGFEKIAIYSDKMKTPTHAARQLDNGSWTSKLGRCNDISHDVIGVSGSTYGQIAVFMKRPVQISHK